MAKYYPIYMDIENKPVLVVVAVMSFTQLRLYLSMEQL